MKVDVIESKHIISKYESNDYANNIYKYWDIFSKFEDLDKAAVQSFIEDSTGRTYDMLVSWIHDHLKPLTGGLNLTDCSKFAGCIAGILSQINADFTVYLGDRRNKVIPPGEESAGHCWVECNGMLFEHYYGNGKFSFVKSERRSYIKIVQIDKFKRYTKLL